MTVFDLLFLLLLLVTLFSLLAAAWFALRRQFSHSRRILVRLLAGAALYLLVVILASLFLPSRVVRLGEPQCFDDWCATLTAFQKTPAGSQSLYRVQLSLSSRARGTPQRENDVVFYVVDSRGRRYNPQADPTDVPLDVLLQPQQSVLVTRSFAIPGDTSGVSAVLTHEGGFPIGWCIIGYDTWFRKPPRIPLS